MTAVRDGIELKPMCLPLNSRLELKRPRGPGKTYETRPATCLPFPALLLAIAQQSGNTIALALPQRLYSWQSLVMGP